APRQDRSSRCPSVSRWLRIAPARTSAGPETTSPVGRTKPSHSRCARTCGSSFAMCSVAFWPEIHEADRLDALRFNLIEIPNPLRLHLEVAVELGKAAVPRAHICLALSFLLVVEQRKLP